MNYFKRFSWNEEHSLWLYLDLIIVPEKQKIRFLQFFHDRGDRGHYGFSKTYTQLRKSVYWESMVEDLEAFIETCPTCQSTKNSDHKRQGFLHPLPIPSTRFDSLSFDFKPLPKSVNGNDFAWVITDRLTKLIRVLPCCRTLSSEQAANLFYNKWYLAGFGFPLSIVSDRDPRFTSKFWLEFSRLIGFTPEFTTSRHQQANGQAESSINIIITALIQQSNTRQNNWDTLLPSITFAYNNSIHSSTGFTPFYLAFGFESRTFPSISKKEKGNLHQAFGKYEKDLITAHANIQRRQDHMAGNYNRSHRKASYSKGELVLLSRAGISLSVDANSPNTLLQQWFGPYKIMEFDSVRSNATLELPESMRCLNTFHVSHIKRWKDSTTKFPGRNVIPIPAPQLDEEGFPAFEVESIVDFRIHGRSKIPQFRVRWCGYGRSHDTWEPLESLDHAHESVSEFLEINPEIIFALPSPPVGHVESGGSVAKE